MGRDLVGEEAATWIARHTEKGLGEGEVCAAFSGIKLHLN